MQKQPAVLIADDEDICLKITTKLLEPFGLRVLCARDGVEAVYLFEKYIKEIKLVILDIQMPRMNGIEAFRRIRNLSQSARVVFASGYINTTYRAEIDVVGMAGFIKKPLNPEDLCDLLSAGAPEKGSTI